LDLLFVASLVLVGFAAGMFGSMLGLGGGILVVPLLTVGMGVEIHKAIGTSLISVIATSCGGASVYVKARMTNIRLAMVLETVTTMAALAAGLIASALSAGVLSVLFAVLQVYAAYSMALRRAPKETVATGEVAAPVANGRGLFFSDLSETYYDKALKRIVKYDVRSVPGGLAASTIAGGVSGLLGVGGGIIQVPVMNVIMGVPIKASMATSNFMVGITAAASAYIYYGNGHILPMLVAPTAIGVFAGAQAGSRLAQRLHGDVLRRLFAVVLLIVAAQMVLRSEVVDLFR
jgi:uncharacterized membrane protein YfcA